MKKVIYLSVGVFLLMNLYFLASFVRGEGELGAVSNIDGETLAEMKKRIGFDEVWPSEDSAHEYVGVKMCSMCHQDQYHIWLESAHAKAYGTLGTPAAKELGRTLGIENPQQSGKCLRCHSTAYAFGEQVVTQAIAVEEGISCESCHGPGRDYSNMGVMIDHEKAVANGLNTAHEQACLKCHNQTAPNVKEFHFAEDFKKIQHPILR